METTVDRTEKERLVASMHQTLADANLVVVTHYLGMTVTELGDLRTKMRAAGAGLGESAADLAAFGAIAAGGAGCVLGGWAADRVGRERLTIWSMGISGACATLIGLTAGSPAVAVAIAVVWGFAVVADSAQFSALVTELAPAHAVGTALTLQTSLGFLLTMASIQLVPRLVGAVGWQWAFVALAVGPVLGIGAMRRLMALRTTLHRG